MRVLLLVCLAMTGCASTIRIEAEHISHPLAGWPCEPQSGSEDEVNQVLAIASWRGDGPYLDIGLGQKTHGRNGNGFTGPALTGVVRVGYEWRLK